MFLIHELAHGSLWFSTLGPETEEQIKLAKDKFHFDL